MRPASRAQILARMRPRTRSKFRHGGSQTVRTVTETFFRIYYVEYTNLFESSLVLHLSA